MYCNQLAHFLVFIVPSLVSGGIQFVPWRTCWFYLALLWCPCPPLPVADVIRDLCLHLGWCIRARCHSMEHPGILLLFVVRLSPSWCSLLRKAETRGMYDHSVSGSQSGKCLQHSRLNSCIPFPCQHHCVLQRCDNTAAKQQAFQEDHMAGKITTPVPQGGLRFKSEAKKQRSKLGSIYLK